MIQKLYYDKNAKDLSMLTPGATVHIGQGDKKELSTKCKVISDANYPRSYIVQTLQGKHVSFDETERICQKCQRTLKLKLVVTMTQQQ